MKKEKFDGAKLMSKLKNVKKEKTTPAKDKKKDKEGKHFDFKAFAKSRKALALAAVAVLLIGSCTVYGGVNSKEADMGSNPVDGSVMDSTMVLLSGDGYSLSKEQKLQYNLEKKEVVNKELQNLLTTTGITGLSSFSSTSNLASSLYRPIVITNMRTQTLEEGDEVEFYVYARTYEKKAIDEKYYTAKYNKKTLKGTKSYVDLNGAEWSGSSKDTKYVKMTYTFKVKKGSKNVYISVEDKKKKTKTEATYVIKGTKARKSIGDIRVFIDMTDLDMDSVSGKVACKKGDTVRDILEVAAKEGGYGITYSNDKIVSMSGVSLSSSKQEDLKAVLGSKYTGQKTKNVLANGDIVSSAAWVIYVNGDSGKKCTKKLERGMTVKAKYVTKITPEAAKYTIKVYGSTGGSATVDGSKSVTAEKGKTLSLKASADDGYKFVGWTVLDGDAVIADKNSDNTKITIGSEDSVVQAVFEKNSPEPTSEDPTKPTESTPTETTPTESTEIDNPDAQSDDGE